MYRRVLTASCFLLCLLSPVVHAAAGDLDTSFGGGDGWVSTGFGGEAKNDSANAVVRQADGKLVIAGSAFNTTMDILLVRYNSDGSLDTGFGSSGKVITAVSAGNDIANGLIVQADGKLVVAGQANGVSTVDMAVVRYNSDGTLDTTFDSDGIVTTAMGAGTDVAHSIAQQLDGKLVVAGYTQGGNQDIVLARYNTDGSLDTTFSADGKVTTALNLGGGLNEQALSIIAQADGKLVITGFTDNGGTLNDFAVLRYNSNGTLDTTFNTTGRTVTAAAGENYPQEIIQQADGKYVVAGFTDASGITVARYTSAGALDTTFNTTGRVITVVGTTSDSAYSVVQQADGKLLVSGIANIGGQTDFAVVRYTTAGALDATFDTDGKVTTAISSAGTPSDLSYASLLQPDGNLVVVGQSLAAPTQMDVSLVRYTSTGALDTAFDTDGKVMTGAGATSVDSGRSIIQQADGKLVVAGSSTNGSNDDFALARYDSNGTLDTAFNTTGKITTAVGSGFDIAYSVIQQADGKLVAAGSDGSDFALVRYNSNGSLDTGFDADGKLTTAISAASDQIYSVIQQADGKLVAAGAGFGSNQDFALARYNANGSLDNTFSGDGKLTTAIGAGAEWAYSVIQQADGKLVAAGQSHNGSNNDFALVRYNSDGSLDTSFSGDGMLTTPIGGSSADVAFSVMQQADGKLIVVGQSTAGTYDFAVVRYNSDGSLDTSFSGDGMLTTVIGTGDDFATSAVLQADGKLVVAGYSNAPSLPDVALVRYNTDGSLDTAFSGDGKLTTALGAVNDYAFAVIQQADGKLAVAGYATAMPTGQEFVVARFESGMCFAGKYWNGTVCVDADAGNYVPAAGATSQTACAAETYQPLTGQSSCTTATACAVGSTYETTAPTLISDRVCSAVSSCALGSTFETVAPTLTSNRVCSAVSSCALGSTFETVAPTLTSNRVCSAVSSCALGSTFEAAAPTLVSNRVCSAVSSCALGTTFETVAPTLLSNRVCSAVSSCALGSTYETVAPTLMSDRACTAVSSCALGSTFETAAPTLVSNRVCSAVSSCVLGTSFETAAPTLNADRMCSAVSSCVAGSTYEATAPTLFADRACTAYSVENCATFALAANACTSCQAGFNLVGGNCIFLIAGDTDADGFGDVATWHTTTGNGYQYLMSSNSLRASAPNTGVPFAGYLPSAYTKVAVADFNLDFTQDVLMRNNSNGTWAMFEFAVGAPGAVAMNVPMSASLTNAFVAAADFNGDGYKDVLLRNSSTGVWTLNLLQGDVVLSSNTVSAALSSDWQFAAAADLNGDGTADLLLRSTSTQQWYLYELSGATVLRSGALGMVSTGWSFVGTGDFNADGIQDVMLRRASDGVWYEYTFNDYATAATTRFSSVGAVPMNTSLLWQVLSLADVDGSGSTDVVLYRASTNTFYLYGMGGVTGRTVVGATVLPVPTSTDWVYQTMADYNGDGRLDILMRNTATGGYYTGKWHMYGFNGYTAGAVWSFYGYATALTSDLNVQVIK